MAGVAVTVASGDVMVRAGEVTAAQPESRPAMSPARPREAILMMPRFLEGRLRGLADLADIGALRKELRDSARIAKAGGGCGIPRLGEVVWWVEIGLGRGLVEGSLETVLFGKEDAPSWIYSASDTLTVSHSYMRMGDVGKKNRREPRI